MVKAITNPMREALRNLAAGKSMCYGLSGRAAHGGFIWTRRALFERGYVAFDPAGNVTLTDAGRAVITPPATEGAAHD